ncbi:SagB/ThcOx family dehydrogenase [Sphaerisporangium sp. NBC_01403]|uniref:SagB/ThcOx family dehydrogenase n=1 Tax=Sphaerisporangium sp. NBC_01403 TaxID=2903599 RepID=UPI00324A62C3
MTETSVVTPDGQEHWLPLVAIRPGHDRGLAVISDPINHRRAAVDVESLVNALLPSAGRPEDVDRAERLTTEFERRGWLPAGELGPDRLAMMRRWWERGWHPSLSYYLWSRHHNFRDSDDPRGAARRSALSEYLRRGEPRPRVKPEGARVPLPAPPAPPADRTFGRLLMARRTVRGYTPDPVGIDKLSGVLHHGLDDIRALRELPKDDPLNWLRSHGSPFDFYVVNYAAEGLDPGIYHYSLDEHVLTAVAHGDHRADMVKVLVGMRGPETAAWTLVMVADFQQYQWRYRHERALRHIYMAAGRIAQRLILVGFGFGLGSLPTPATRDQDTCDLLRLDPVRQTPVYTLTMGPAHLSGDKDD